MATLQLAVIDGGNSAIKGKSVEREAMYPHAIKEISEAEYAHAMLRGAAEETADIIKVNGVPYMLGDLAMQRGYTGRQAGRARYVRSYYGVLTAAMLFRLYERSMKNIVLFASHAPQDLEFRDAISIAAGGEWEVTCGDETRYYNVRKVYSFDEPLGGLMNVLLTQDGKRYQRTDLKRGSVLVIDVGGHTTDFVEMREGKIDYTSDHSEELGVLGVEQSFSRLLLQEHKAKFARSGALAPDRVREAIRSGKFRAGGYGELDVTALVEAAAQPLLNRIEDLFLAYGGTPRYEFVLLTGGGCGLLERQIKERLAHPVAMLAERGAEIHLANVRGGLKLARLFESRGEL